MSRQTKEWIGSTPDARVPPRVRLRIFEAYDGRCACCNCPIRPGDAWELDHYVPLISGGANSETNMRPLLREHHKLKTKADQAAKSKSYQRRSKHVGIKRKAKQPIRGWRRFDGTPVFNPKLRAKP